MNRKLRSGLIALLALICLGSGIKIALKVIEYQRGDEIYAEAEELVGLPDFTDLPLPAPPDPATSVEGGEPAEPYIDPYADALRNMDFTALQEKNSDVFGWILIPGTNISYPLVQGSDNSYYLTHTWRKSRNSVGAIFLECQNSRSLGDFNTIIYGHRMNNRSMFGTLHNFKSNSYWAAHPYVYITDKNGSYRYQIFAAYEVSVYADTYRLGLSSTQGKQAFIDFCVSQSAISTGIVPMTYDRILTLSTCTQNGSDTRWVVQAVLRGTPPPVEDSPPVDDLPAEPQQPGDGSEAEQPTDSSSPDGSQSGGEPQSEPPADADSAADTSSNDGSQVEESPVSQDVQPSP